MKPLSPTPASKDPGKVDATIKFCCSDNVELVDEENYAHGLVDYCMSGKDVFIVILRHMFI